jgi:hypothetical protein
MCATRRKWLEELNWPPPRSLKNGNQGEAEVFDSKPGDVVASPSDSLKAQQKKVA